MKNCSSNGKKSIMDGGVYACRLQKTMHRSVFHNFKVNFKIILKTHHSTIKENYKKVKGDKKEKSTHRWFGNFYDNQTIKIT